MIWRLIVMYQARRLLPEVSGALAWAAILLQRSDLTGAEVLHDEKDIMFLIMQDVSLPPRTSADRLALLNAAG